MNDQIILAISIIACSAILFPILWYRNEILLASLNILLFWLNFARYRNAHMRHHHITFKVDDKKFKVDATNQQELSKSIKEVEQFLKSTQEVHQDASK